MSAALLIARRELRSYLQTWMGYVIIALVLFIEGLLFNAFVLGGTAKLSGEVLAAFFNLASGVSMVAAVFITMRLLAEERQTGTIALLYSSPIRDGDIVLGKFLSALAFFALLTVGTVFMPLLILVNGKIAIGQVLAGYFGLMLLGAAALAVGVLGSALARSGVLAAVISGTMLAGLVTCWLLARVTEKPLTEVFNQLAFWQMHFPEFQSGIIHVRDVVYYLAVTYVALFTATRVLEARRWR